MSVVDDDNNDTHGFICQGRTLADTATGRYRKRSFMPPSFFEDDTVDFPDDLDTSFFTRVSNGHTPTANLLSLSLSIQFKICAVYQRSVYFAVSD